MEVQPRSRGRGGPAEEAGEFGRWVRQRRQWLMMTQGDAEAARDAWRLAAGLLGALNDPLVDGVRAKADRLQ